MAHRWCRRHGEGRGTGLSSLDPVKALLLENVHPEARRLLEAVGLEVTEMRSALDERDLCEALPGVQVLGIRSKTKVTAAALAAAPDLVAVGAFCIGTDQIDLTTASGLGVAVFNAPYSNTRSVVELAIAEIIAMTRRLTEKDHGMHAGVWDKSARGAHEVRGRTLGIVGYGNIGAQLSVVAEALGLRVVFFDTADKLALGNARRCVSMDELLESADIVSLHVDGRPSTTCRSGRRNSARCGRERCSSTCVAALSSIMRRCAHICCPVIWPERLSTSSSTSLGPLVKS